MSLDKEKGICEFERRGRKTQFGEELNFKKFTRFEYKKVDPFIPKSPPREMFYIK